jgi:hypothetical protein
MVNVTAALATDNQHSARFGCYTNCIHSGLHTSTVQYSRVSDWQLATVPVMGSAVAQPLQDRPLVPR